MNPSILRLPPAVVLGAVTIVTSILPRSVDAAAPVGHYVVTAGGGTGNGTVYDTKSKLTWQQTVTSTNFTHWTDAKAYCQSPAVSASLGGSGWRLPTLKELASIIDFSQTTGPMIDSTAFPSTPSTYFYSSTPGTSAGQAWFISFASGASLNNAADGNNGLVRCVR